MMPTAISTTRWAVYQRKENIPTWVIVGVFDDEDRAYAYLSGKDVLGFVQPFVEEIQVFSPGDLKSDPIPC